MDTADISTQFPAEAGFRMPAEWEARDCTLMAWPVRPEAWLSGLSEAREGYAEVAAAIAAFEPLKMVARPDAAADARSRLPGAVEIWDYSHDDSWMRDNGPTFLLDDRGGRIGVDWGFNAWGRKYSPYDADDALAERVLARMGVPRVRAPLVLEGGSIHSDGEGTILTTEECLLNKNRNPSLSRADIEAALRRYAGAKKILWIPRGLEGDETDGHVDNIACFVSPGVIAYQGPLSEENRRAMAGFTDAAGRKPVLVEIPAPPARSFAGEVLTLSYINYYPTSGGLVVPVFGKSGDAELRRSDDKALGILQELYPDRKIVPVDGMRIIKGGGNVHCITQQVPAVSGRPA